MTTKLELESAAMCSFFTLTPSGITRIEGSGLYAARSRNAKIITVGWRELYTGTPPQGANLVDGIRNTTSAGAQAIGLERILQLQRGMLHKIYRPPMGNGQACWLFWGNGSRIECPPKAPVDCTDYKVKRRIGAVPS